MKGSATEAGDALERARKLLPTLLRIVRFGIVGVTATLTHAGVSLASLHWLHVPPVVANGMGFCIAFLVSMAGHSLFTFRQKMTPAKAMRFTTVALSSVGFSSLVVLAGQHLTSLPPNIYLTAAALLTPAFNFVCHSLWTFSHRHEKAD